MAGGDSRIPVKVYLASMVVRGQIVTQHKRLSDYLNSRVDDGTIRLEAAEIQSVKANGISTKLPSILIYTRQVILVVDLSSGSLSGPEDVGFVWADRVPQKVRMEVGSFWLDGEVHLVPGSELITFAEGKISFIPMTAARFVDFSVSGLQTFLINRGKINCLMAQSEARPENLCQTRGTVR